jgi:hypothetical protein
MKTAEKIPIAGQSHAPLLTTSWGRVGSPKIQPAHLEKLTIVYVRQSTQKQVLENQQSTERQYAFAEDAVACGWPRERVLTIDDWRGPRKTGMRSSRCAPFSAHSLPTRTACTTATTPTTG